MLTAIPWFTHFFASQTVSGVQRTAIQEQGLYNACLQPYHGLHNSLHPKLFLGYKERPFRNKACTTHAYSHTMVYTILCTPNCFWGTKNGHSGTRPVQCMLTAIPWFTHFFASQTVSGVQRTAIQEQGLYNACLQPYHGLHNSLHPRLFLGYKERPFRNKACTMHAYSHTMVYTILCTPNCFWGTKNGHSGTRPVQCMLTAIPWFTQFFASQTVSGVQRTAIQEQGLYNACLQPYHGLHNSLHPKPFLGYKERPFRNNACLQPYHGLHNSLQPKFTWGTSNGLFSPKRLFYICVSF